MSGATLTRQATLTREPDAPQLQPQADMTVAMSFASDVPYERWWGVEVLDCTPGAVRLGRLNDGAALLYNHDLNDLRGHHLPGSVIAYAKNLQAQGKLQCVKLSQLNRAIEERSIV